MCFLSTFFERDHLFTPTRFTRTHTHASARAHTHTHKHTHKHTHARCLSWAKLTWQGVRAKFRANLTRSLCDVTGGYVSKKNRNVLDYLRVHNGTICLNTSKRDASCLCVYIHTYIWVYIYIYVYSYLFLTRHTHTTMLYICMNA